MFANSEAPGMAKEGATVAGNFQEGQTLESAFTFQPGKCYTVVAVGAGIQEIDILLALLAHEEDPKKRSPSLIIPPELVAFREFLYALSVNEHDQPG